MLLDTNILIYAINSDSPKNKIAQLFIQTHKKDLVIAHQNIFEALRVLTHPKFSHPMKVSDAQEAVLGISEVCPLITPNYKTLYLALALIKEYKLIGNQIFDAYLAATALSNDITTIATDNIKDFQKFGITLVNPFVSKN